MAAIKLAVCKKVIGIAICIYLIGYVLICIRNDFKSKRDVDDDDRSFVTASTSATSSAAYFVNTPGCHMPHLDAFNDFISTFMSIPKNFKCNKSLTRTSDVGTELWLNMNADELLSNYNISDLNDVTCSYAEVHRKTDNNNIYGDPVTFKLQQHQPVNIPKWIEFIRVDCIRDGDMEIFYKDFHFFALDKKTQTDSSAPPSDNEPRMLREDSRQLDRVSVMVFGIDSVSHLNYRRQMRRTVAYLQENLSHVEFWGYNKLADNTYPNLIPVLTGLDEIELNRSCLVPVNQIAFDNCDFVWKRYKEAGYQTAFAEDVAGLSLFNYLKPGFTKQPTDYYFRPMMIEMENEISYEKFLNVKLCQGGRRTCDVIFELIRKMIPHLQMQDFFSMYWTAAMTHDDFNMPQLIDVDVRQIFETLNIAGLMNKTVIFFMSDHGLRWGRFRRTYQGMMEERQPLLIALFPSWFKEHYPTAVKNLEQNANRLTSHYDLHATLMDLVNPQKLRDTAIEQRSLELTDADSMLPRGISLFLPIPATRTCDQAGIAPHWCTCHQLQDLPANDGRVTRAARFVVKLINGRLKNHRQCRTLYLNSILDAKVAATHHNIVKDITNDYSIDITLRIQTKPGLGEYEATVRMSSYSVSLTGTISRLNLYARQSYCIDDFILKMYCYCS